MSFTVAPTRLTSTALSTTLRRTLWAILLPAILLLSATLLPLSSVFAGPERKYPKPDRVDIEHLKLDLDVDLRARRVAGTATITLRLKADVKAITLHAVDLAVTAVTADRARDLRWYNTGRELVVTAPDLTRGRRLTLTVEYSVTEPKSGLFFRGPTPEDPDVPWQVWSQGESTHNRHWFPCLDHPGERQSTEVIVRVPAGMEALSNGKLVSRKDLKTEDGARGTRFHWRQKRPHPAYLVALIVGEFEVIEETWRDKPVLYYVPVGSRAIAKNSFENTRRMLDHFSELTGYEYPWDKYAQVVVEQFHYGGMENTGATTLNASTLHDDRAHLDFRSDGLVAHELAHQWFGDLITCRDWSHIWLNEGFATYFEALWCEKDRGRDEFLYNMHGKSHGAINGGRSKPVVDLHYGSSDSVFDARAYPKGAWILHQLRRRLGDETFFRGLRHYVLRNRDKSIETVSLRMALERSSGESLGRAFHDLTERPGHPVFRVDMRWHAERGVLDVRLRQTQKSEAFHVPGVVTATLADGRVVRRERQLTGKDETMTLALVERPVSVRFDPDEAVLKEVTVHKAQDWWLAQLERDPNVIGRIRAARELAKRRRPELMKALCERLASDPFQGVRRELAGALAKIGGGQVRAALIKGLADKHPEVRAACAENLGRYRDDRDAGEALNGLLAKGDASVRVESAALRSLAKVRGVEARAVLEAWLSKDGHRDQLRTAALNGILGFEDPGDVALVLTYSRGPWSPDLRRTAISGLGRLGRLASCPEASLTKILERLTGCLNSGSVRLRNTALHALRDLGAGAKPLRALLETLAEHDPEERVRKSASDALKRLGDTGKALPEVDRLRKELGKLRREAEATKRRVRELEAKVESNVESKGSGSGDAPKSAGKPDKARNPKPKKSEKPKKSGKSKTGKKSGKGKRRRL